jgi:hypothetical protein
VVQQAIASLQAAYGLRPDVPAAWPDAPAADPRPGPQDLADDNLVDGWTDQLLFRLIASLVPRGPAGPAPDHRAGRHRLVRGRAAPLRRPSGAADPAVEDRRHPDQRQGGTAPYRPGRRRPAPPAGRTSTPLPDRRRTRGRPPAGLRARRRPSRPAAKRSGCQSTMMAALCRPSIRCRTAQCLRAVSPCVFTFRRMRGG